MVSLSLLVLGYIIIEIAYMENTITIVNITKEFSSSTRTTWESQMSSQNY